MTPNRQQRNLLRGGHWDQRSVSLTALTALTVSTVGSSRATTLSDLIGFRAFLHARQPRLV